MPALGMRSCHRSTVYCANLAKSIFAEMHRHLIAYIVTGFAGIVAHLVVFDPSPQRCVFAVKDEDAVDAFHACQAAVHHGGGIAAVGHLFHHPQALHRVVEAAVVA